MPHYLTLCVELSDGAGNKQDETVFIDRNASHKVKKIFFVVLAAVSKSLFSWKIDDSVFMIKGIGTLIDVFCPFRGGLPGLQGVHQLLCFFQRF